MSANADFVRYIVTEWFAPRITGAEFDRWLNRMKAEAWDEGKRAEETAWMHAFDGHPVEEGEVCDQCPTDNPYREDYSLLPN